MTKVFWSWQSDRPGKTGRHFVRSAIQDAIDSILAEGELEESERDLHLDHDRKGASGSPDLARLILDKIKTSAIFIADVTKTGQSDGPGEDDKPKPLINPNVAIELGYALSTVGDAGLLMVMNAAYGGRETLPFDLSHKAGPIIYNLAEDATKHELEVAKKQLVKQLTEAIRACATTVSFKEAPPPAAYKPVASPDGVARFRAQGQPLGITDPFPQATDGTEITLRPASAVWLRVFPAYDSKFHIWAPTLRERVRGGFRNLMLPFMTDGGTFSLVIADDGAGMVSPGEAPEAESVTFVFECGEIWGVNSFVLDASGIRLASEGQSIIPFVYKQITDYFRNYTALLVSVLKVQPPYKWMLGMENLKGRSLVIPTTRGTWSGPMGRCITNTVIEEGTFEPTDSPYRCLRPFFERLASTCSLDPVSLMQGYPD